MKRVFQVALCMVTCGLTFSQSFADNFKIASTSLCGDSYLLALKLDQAAALSWQSRDKISLASPAQRELPQVWDAAETLVASDADIILYGPGEGVTSSKFANLSGKNIISLKWGEDFKTVIDNAQALGAPNAFKIDLEQRLNALETHASVREFKPKILYMSRSGATAGADTYVDAAIKAAGGQNLITSPGWQSRDPEFLLSLEPDLIVTSFFTDGYESVQAKSIRNRVLRDFLDRHPQLDIPGALWPCASPHLIDVAERISKAIDRLP